MKITLDTADFSALDVRILTLLLEGTSEEPAAKVEVKPAAKAEAKPAKKATAKKPAPEPEPDPVAEEPLPDDEPEDEVDEPEGSEDSDEMSDDDLLTLAVKKATEMVAGGEAAKVREALDAAGANRVRELNKDNVREFFEALS